MDKQNFDIHSENQDTKEEIVQQPMHDAKFDWKKETLEWVQAIVVALVIALVLRTYVFTLVRVSGSSMEPTLQDNDRLVVRRLMYTPKRGDVIILRPPMHKDTPYIKRVIALPGETVDIDFEKHIVYVDGKPILEKYIYEPTARPGNMRFPLKVEENTVFVLGDNRNNSRDSRYSDVGLIPYDAIMGKATYRIWPLNNFGYIYEEGEWELQENND